MNAKIFYIFFETVLQPKSSGTILSQKRDVPDFSWSYEEILKVSCSWAKQYSLALKSTHHKAHGFSHISHIDSNWVNLKSDGSVRLDEGFAATGGFVHDHNDRWIIGYCRYLGNCTVVDAELWGILDGLNLILDRCFWNVIIQTDSIEAINAIQEGSLEISNSALVRRIHFTLTALEQWKIQHISREENFVADNLAKSVNSKRPGLRLIVDPPMRI
ncbi:hypothetical protein J1N35_031180 [Gossypium stocksii]|uniref:RNase H type-1 domain-containing protein n=1 Tax=Gossypium stocksii TaxID=47602 RepID=A0A9D3V1C1_9ROSI|nr:hypothetical protein J1N35_031180 [Gossypium stocksii]